VNEAPHEDETYDEEAADIGTRKRGRSIIYSFRRRRKYDSKGGANV